MELGILTQLDLHSPLNGAATCCSAGIADVGSRPLAPPGPIMRNVLETPV